MNLQWILVLLLATVVLTKRLREDEYEGMANREFYFRSVWNTYLTANPNRNSIHLGGKVHNSRWLLEPAWGGRYRLRSVYGTYLVGVPHFWGVARQSYARDDSTAWYVYARGTDFTFRNVRYNTHLRADPGRYANAASWCREWEHWQAEIVPIYVPPPQPYRPPYRPPAPAPYRPPYRPPAPAPYRPPVRPPTPPPYRPPVRPPTPKPYRPPIPPPITPPITPPTPQPTEPRTQDQPPITDINEIFNKRVFLEGRPEKYLAIDDDKRSVMTSTNDESAVWVLELISLDDYKCYIRNSNGQYLKAGSSGLRLASKDNSNVVWTASYANELFYFSNNGVSLYLGHKDNVPSLTSAQRKSEGWNIYLVA